MRSEVRSCLGVIAGSGHSPGGPSRVGPVRPHPGVARTVMLWLHSAALGDRLGCRRHNRACRLPRPGGVRPTDRSGVGCSHREGCPLFPLLNASLRGWRDHYCDSADRWRDCARYKMSLTGQLVPITLLPNGHDAQLLRPDPGQAPPSRLDSGSPETAVSIPQFEPAPASAPAPAPAQLLEPSPPSPVAQSPRRPPARLTRRVRRVHGSTRRWWTRLTDWMTGPA